MSGARAPEDLWFGFYDAPRVGQVRRLLNDAQGEVGYLITELLESDAFGQRAVAVVVLWKHGRLPPPGCGTSGSATCCRRDRPLSTRRRR